MKGERRAWSGEPYLVERGWFVCARVGRARSLVEFSFIVFCIVASDTAAVPGRVVEVPGRVAPGKAKCVMLIGSGADSSAFEANEYVYVACKLPVLGLEAPPICNFPSSFLDPLKG